MDFNKILNISKMPIIILVAIGVLSLILGSILSLGVLLGLLSFVIGIIVYIWAGYLATKAKMSLIEAGVTGAIVAFVSGLINGLIGLLYGIFTSGPNAFAYILTLGILLSGLLFGIVIGFVLGVIGGFIGQKF